MKRTKVKKRVDQKKVAQKKIMFYDRFMFMCIGFNSGNSSTHTHVMKLNTAPRRCKPRIRLFNGSHLLTRQRLCREGKNEYVKNGNAAKSEEKKAMQKRK